MAFANTRNTKYVYLRAFDNVDPSERVVINCGIRQELSTLNRTVDEYAAAWRDHIAWSYVDSLYVYCKGEVFYVDMWNFEATDSSGNQVFDINNNNFRLSFVGSPGQREFVFSLKSDNHKLDMLVTARDRAFRIIRSTYDADDVKGVLFTGRVVTMDTLEFVELI